MDAPRSTPMPSDPTQNAESVADNRSVWDQIGDSLASIVKKWAEAQCACSHDKNTHWRGEGECMASTDAEVWACGCHEYRAARIDGSGGVGAQGDDPDALLVKDALRPTHRDGEEALHE